MGILICHNKTGENGAWNVYAKNAVADHSDRNDWAFQGTAEVACNTTPAWNLNPTSRGNKGEKFDALRASPHSDGIWIQPRFINLQQNL